MKTVPKQTRTRLSKALSNWGLDLFKFVFEYSIGVEQDPLSSLEGSDSVFGPQFEQKAYFSDSKYGDLDEDLGGLVLSHRIGDVLKITPDQGDGALVTLNFKQEITRILLLTHSGIVFKDLPFELETLQNLVIIGRRKDFGQEVILSKSFSRLRNIRQFAFVNLNISMIPEELFFLNSLKSCILSGINGLSSPPAEIYQQGLHSIRNYYQQLKEAEESDYLYEAKMVLVGRGFAGKTTIVNKLTDPKYLLEEDLESTEGIVIQEWDLPIHLEKSDTFRFNIWDFGGQEKYDATHQFFITERTLYLFVTEARQESNYLDFDYWLNIIEMLSNGSPVIIIQNKIDKRQKQIPSDRYRGLFEDIHAFLDVSCAKGYENSLKKLEDNIKLAVRRLPQVGDKLPKAWVDIRKELEASDLDYISYSDYCVTCEKHGLNEKQAKFLSRYFHDLGIIVHYSQDVLLKNTVIVNPDWAVDGVYNVLDTRKVAENNGRFTRKDLDQI